MVEGAEWAYWVGRGAVGCDMSEAPAVPALSVVVRRVGTLDGP